MSAKTLIFAFVALFVIAGLSYGGIWLQAQQAAEQEMTQKNSSACLNLIVEGEDFDTETIYLALVQNADLTGNPETLELKNEELGLIITISEEQVALTSSKSVWLLNPSQQETLSEITASVVGRTFGSNSETLDPVQNKLEKAENLTLTDNQRTLNLTFSCV